MKMRKNYHQTLNWFSTRNKYKLYKLINNKIIKLTYPLIHIPLQLLLYIYI